VSGTAKKAKMAEASAYFPVVVHDARMNHHVRYAPERRYDNDVVSYFHHCYMEDHDTGPTVLHGGGVFAAVDPELDYVIEHCSCGMHAINDERGIGHDETMRKTLFVFTALCRGDHRGWWHVESGKTIARL